MPLAAPFPMPPVGVDRLLPLEEQETSYLAAAERMDSFFCTNEQYTLAQVRAQAECTSSGPSAGRCFVRCARQGLVPSLPAPGKVRPWSSSGYMPRG